VLSVDLQPVLVVLGDVRDEMCEETVLTSLRKTGIGNLVQCVNKFCRLSEFS
jgi:hypothetical protein